MQQRRTQTRGLLVCNTLGSSRGGSPRCHPEPRLLLPPAQRDLPPTAARHMNFFLPLGATTPAARHLQPASYLPLGAPAPAAHSNITCHPAQRHHPQPASGSNVSCHPNTAAPARRSGSCRPAQQGLLHEPPGQIYPAHVAPSSDAAVEVCLPTSGPATPPPQRLLPPGYSCRSP